VLEVTDIHTFYGDSHVLHGISLAVARRQCVALLGRNGAGKTTVLRSILGLAPIRSGSIRFKEHEISREPTFRIVRRGIGYVPDNRGIFASVTVEEHLALAQRACRAKVTNCPTERIYELFPGLARRRRSYGNQLSGGEQQMLAIGRALMMDPSLLVLDEPSEGLAPAIIDSLEDVLRVISSTGIPILIVEQDYYLAMALATYVYVLSQGELKFSGTPDVLAANDQIKSTYLSV
jgi:branched-chain amino acid transport system ATP-binding protein